jgi:hypothetical protein
MSGASASIATIEGFPARRSNGRKCGASASIATIEAFLRAAQNGPFLTGPALD